MIIVVQEPGTRLGKTSEQLKIMRDGGEFKVAFRLIESIVCLTKCYVSYDVNIACAQYGIPVFYMRKGHPIMATLPYAHHGFVITRKSQFDAYTNGQGLLVMTAIILGAITNKIRMVKYIARNTKRANPQKASEYQDKAARMELLRKEVKKIETQLKVQLKQKFSTKSIEPPKSKQQTPTESNEPPQSSNEPPQSSKNPPNLFLNPNQLRAKLMGYEGSVSRIYYSLLTDVFPLELQFEKRVRRPPTDPINASISFGNHLLANEIMTAIVVAGLDPFAGFMHSDRSGRPSLVFDMNEEFRQPIVDRLILRLFRKRILQGKHFSDEGAENGVRFTNSGMEIFLREFYYMVRKQGEIEKGHFITYNQLMLRQARQLVRFFLGKIKNYKPFLLKW
ncbi:MAG: CRISPR-associated endonuclease Cas1 [Promethearchaeota archaeon]